MRSTIRSDASEVLTTLASSFAGESRIDELDSPAKDPEGLVRAQWRRMMPNLAVGRASSLFSMIAFIQLTRGTRTDAFLPRKENGNIKKSYLALLEYQPRHPNWVAMQRQNHDAWDWMRVDAARLEWKYLGVKPEEGHLLMDRFFALVFAIEAKVRLPSSLSLDQPLTSTHCRSARSTSSNLASTSSSALATSRRRSTTRFLTTATATATSVRPSNVLPRPA